MAITKPPVKPTWAETAVGSPDIVEPSAPEISAGWPLSTTPPARGRWNWVLNYLMNAVRYFSRRGLVDYDAAETYAFGDIVRGNDGLIYESRQANNTNHQPSTSPTWWGSPGAPTPASSDNTTKLANTAFVQTGLATKANTSGSYPGLTVGAAANATAALAASTAGSVPWTGVTGRPTTVGGYGITDAITTANIGAQSVNYASSAGRAYPYRSDGNPISLIWSGQGGQPNWLLGGNDGTNFYVYNPANFSVYAATYASYAATQAAGASNTSIATTAFANPSQLRAANGYVMLPGGMIFQWGFRASAITPGASPVVFPITFPSACFGVQVTSATPQTGMPPSQGAVSAVGSVTNSGFSLYNAASIVANYYWFAKGA